MVISYPEQSQQSNSSSQQQPAQQFERNFREEDINGDDESRYKPSSRWRKGDQQGVNISNPNQHEEQYFTEKPNTIVPVSPIKGNNLRPSNPLQQPTYYNQPPSPYEETQRAQNIPPQRHQYEHPSQNYYNSPIPHVHDYFHPYPNSHPHYQSYPIIPPTTYVHYPSYQSHPLNTSPIIHHVATPHQPMTQISHPQVATIEQQVITTQAFPKKRIEPVSKQKPVVIEEDPLPTPTVVEEEPEGPPKAVAWSSAMSNATPKKKKTEPPKKEVKKTPVKRLQRHASVPPKFG